MQAGLYATPKIDLTGIRIMGRPTRPSLAAYSDRLAQREKLDLKPIRA